MIKKLVALAAISLISLNCMATWHGEDSVTVINNTDGEVSVRAGSQEITLDAGETGSMKVEFTEREWKGNPFVPSVVQPYGATLTAYGDNVRPSRPLEILSTERTVSVSEQHGRLSLSKSGESRHHKHHRRADREDANEDNDEDND